MTQEVKLDSNKRLLYVAFDRNSTVDSWKASLGELVRLSAESGITRAILDARRQESLASTTELYRFASNLPRHMAFAFLYDRNLAEYQFLETVAVNRGLSVKSFVSEQEASDWLRNQPDRLYIND